MKLDKTTKEIEELEKVMFNNPGEHVADPNIDPAMNVTDPVNETKPTESDASINAKTIQDKARTSNGGSDDEYKTRFINYKTSTDNTIYQLRQGEIALLEKVDMLEQRIASLLKDNDRLSSEKNPFEGLISDDDRNIMGDETVNSIEKLTKAAVEAAVSPLKEELKLTKNELAIARKKSTDDKRSDVVTTFKSRLAQFVPDYASIDTDPNFANWLKQPDSVSGSERLVLFKRAQKNGDVGRVADFFMEFKELTEEPVDPLEEYISPEGSGKKSESVDTKDDTISKAVIDKFYNDAARGKYKNRESLRRELEDKYDRAYIEGRVVL